MSNYAIGLDVHDMSAPVSLNVKQGESGQIINISLRSGGKPYLLPSGAYAVFAGKKPDGKILWNSCQVVRHTIQYEITKQTTAVVGWVPVQIRIYKPDGKLLMTPDFVLIVDAPVAGDEEVIAVSENEITALTELVSEAATLQKAVFWAEYDTTTYAEIKAARDEGQVVLCRRTSNPLVPKLYSVDQFGAHFTSFKDGYNTIWSVSTEDVWSVETNEYPTKDEVPELVKFTAEYGVTTLDEILEAKAAGKVIVCVRVKGGAEIPLYSAGETGGRNAYFSAFVNGTNTAYFCGSAGWSESYDAYPKEDEVSGLVKFTAQYGTTTYAEIKAARDEGQVVLCRRTSNPLVPKLYSVDQFGAHFTSFKDGYNTIWSVTTGDVWSDIVRSYAETPLTVTISGTAASHSASEIIAAIKAEKIVEVNMGTERLQVTAWDESAVTVTCKKAPAPNRSGALLSCNEYTISDAKTVAVVANSAISNNFTAKAGQVVAVANADHGGPSAFKAIDVREEFIATYGTTTFAEIWDAMSAGKAVYCKNGNVTLSMTACIAQSFVAEFGGATESGSVVWKVKSATWSSYNAALDLTVQNGRLYLTVNGTVTGVGVDASTLSALIE